MTANRILLVVGFCVLIALKLFVGTAYAQNIKSPLIPEVNILRGDFEQIRYLKGFKNPLKMEGHFLLSKSNGVIWQGIKPFPALIRISNTGIVTNLAANKEASGASHKKANTVLSNIMLAILSGNQTELSKYFTFERIENKDTWTLQLQPIGKMTRFISRIEVKGDRYIKNVILEETSGDKTELIFSAVSDAPKFLSVEELKYFE